MYRTPAERPKQHLRNPKPTERFTLSRASGFMPTLSVVAILAIAILYGAMGHGILAAVAAVVGIAVVFIVTPRLTRPLVVEVDHGERRLRVGNDDLSFDDVLCASFIVGAKNAFMIVIVLEDRSRGHLAITVTAHAAAAVAAINCALAAEYESLGEMPDGLAEEMRKLAVGFPMSGLNALSPTQCIERLQAFLHTLPIRELCVTSFEAGMFMATATAGGRAVSFEYNVRKDRFAVATPAAGLGGHVELIRIRGSRGDGWQPIATGVVVNGMRNRERFENALPNELRIHAAAEIERLNLLQLKIDPREVRAISRDGLRELREPRARVNAMLDLVLEIGNALPSDHVP